LISALENGAAHHNVNLAATCKLLQFASSGPIFKLCKRVTVFCDNPTSAFVCGKIPHCGHKIQCEGYKGFIWGKKEKLKAKVAIF
jgi:hypothetical protein